MRLPQPGAYEYHVFSRGRGSEVVEYNTVREKKGGGGNLNPTPYYTVRRFFVFFAAHCLVKPRGHY